MQILHLNLLPQGADHAELRYFFDNPNDYQSRMLPLQDIADLIKQAETEVYVPSVLQDLIATGKRLYEWLDGSDRWLGQTLEQQAQGTILAIAAGAGLANLPWELLHDNITYLVQRLPSVVPLRWVSQLGSRYVPQLEAVNAPQNRALNLMFMATSPRGVEPVLHFEEEEGRILAATQRQSHQRIALLVEESGNLDELGFAIKAYGTQHFDGLHLTGHATIQNSQPRFVMETLTGDPAYEGAANIASTLQGYLPPLLFLSGCRTGEGAQAGAVPSLAEALLTQGATAVLCWGQNVLDTDATKAAAELYGALSQGETLALALAKTYRHLLEVNARDWHLLRLYVADMLPGPLVTPPRTSGRRLAPPPSTTIEFLDPVTQQVKVVGRQGFVGRRRQLQACLRVLTQATDADTGQAGVLIYGMGGLGKSALAARLCDRMPHTQRIVWVGRVDEPALIHKLSAALNDRTLREMLQDPREELRYRLRRVFEALSSQAQPLLLVLDDFEDGNLEARNGTYVPTPTAVGVLEALLWVLQQTYYIHKLIITSRYDVEHSALSTVTRQPLEALHGVDLQKKCNGLTGFMPPQVTRDADEKALRMARQMVERQQRALRLADGNPRLLEWLDKVLQSGDSSRPPFGKGGEEAAPASSDQGGAAINAILDALEQNSVDLRKQVLAATLLEQMDEPMWAMLRRGVVYQLPVPRAALEAVCECPPFERGVRESINPAIALGLLEVSPEGDLRIPRILPLMLPEDTEALYRAAAQTLYCLWWEPEQKVSEEQALELVRLGLAARDEEIAVGVGERVATWWNNNFRYAEVLALCRNILEVFKDDYRILGTMARAEQVVGMVAEAARHYETVLKQCPEADLDRRAATLNNMAGIIAQQGYIEWAFALWQESLEILGRTGDVQSKAATLNNMAGVIAQQGHIERALALWQESLEILGRVGDIQGEAITLNNIAGIIAQQGDIEQALALWQESLAIKERIGDVKGKAATLSNMAQVIAQQGDIERALALWQKDLEISERIGDVQSKADTLNNMAQVIAQQGDIERAFALWQESLEIMGRTGDVQSKAVTLNNMAGVIAQQGDIERAFALWQESLEAKECIGDVKGKAVTLSNMAGVIAQQGDIERAFALWQESLEIEEHIGDVKGKAVTLNNMAQVSAQQGDIERALALWQESLEIKERIGDVKGEATTLNNIAQVIAQQGDIERALALWQESLEISERIGDVQGKAVTLNNMAEVAYQQGDLQKSLELFRETAAALGQIKAFGDLFTVLSNLGVADESQSLAYLSQALWLALRIQTPLQNTLTLIHYLLNQVPQGDVLEALLAATALFFCQTRGQGHPQLESLQQSALQLLSAAATAQGIETQESLGEWFAQQQLNDPQVFLPQLNQRLEAIIGDQWLFDPTPFA